MQRQARELTRRRRRQLVAALACVGAAVTAFPNGWEQLAAAPAVSWALGALGVALLWPRDS